MDNKNIAQQFQNAWANRKNRVGILMIIFGGIAYLLFPMIAPNINPEDLKSQKIQKVFSPLDTDLQLERADLDGVATAYKALNEMEMRGKSQEDNVAIDGVMMEVDSLRMIVEQQQEELNDWTSGRKQFSQGTTNHRRGSFNSPNSTQTTQTNNASTQGTQNNATSSDPRQQSTQPSPPKRVVGIRSINATNDFIRTSSGQIKNIGDPEAVNVMNGVTTKEQEKTELDERERSLDAKLQEAQTKNRDTSYTITLPTTSLLTGVLLSGMQAPTSFGSKREPLPATIRLKLDALLPNNYRMDLRDCQGHVSGIGSMSDSRAYLRLESIVCIDEEGRIAESKAQGYATGSDGQAGVPGILVTRNGDVLEGSMWSGLFSGLAEGIAPTRVVGVDVVGNGSGGYQVPDFGAMGASAALNGASTSLDRLSEYYVRMLEEIMPTIDVPAFQEVTFFLQAPLKLTFKE
ncbi:TraB/VirB10 family protein [Vibrio owensii]|uniref:TraB/VirB10 family protein n=1 Tax=Vibrio owensii TaxID=696485 RepID=UPI0040681B98